MNPAPLPGRILFKHPAFDSALLRTMHHTRAGALDSGDILQICLQIEDGNWASWSEVWNTAAERHEETAHSMDGCGYRRSSAMAFLRASEAFRCALFPMLAVRGLSGVEALLDAMQRCFRAALERLPVEFRDIRVPFGDSFLHACLITPKGEPATRPTVIVNSGYTVFLEEEYFLGGADALQRGWNCLLYDGPGQGHTWMRNGLVFQPDWETVLSAVVDSLLVLPGVDPARIAMFGRSFDAALSIRAVAKEHRIAALMVDPGETCRLRAILEGLGIMDGDLDRGATELARQMDTPSGWIGLAIRMNQHGLDDPLEYLKCLRAFDASSHASEIQCPVIVGAAEFDPAAPQARELFEQLRAPKAFHLFRGADAAGDHCELGAAALSQDVYFDWLESIFPAGQAAPAI